MTPLKVTGILVPLMSHRPRIPGVAEKEPNLHKIVYDYYVAGGIPESEAYTLTTEYLVQIANSIGVNFTVNCTKQ